MLKSHYNYESLIEKDFWWFKVRRFFFSNEIKRLINKEQKILDIGSSSGTNLRMFEEMGYKNYVGIELSRIAISHCKKKGFSKIIYGDACNLPFQSSSKDFIIASDILEHIDNHELALSELKRVLKKNSFAIITVPAFNFLWSNHDVSSMHKRRYTKKILRNLLKSKNLHIEKIFYFNFLLFIPILFARYFFKIFKINIKNENKINNRFLNKIFEFIFKIDILLAEKINPFFGVSIFALVRKIN